MNIHIQCKSCGYHQKVDRKLFANVLGAATAGFGYFAWVSFLFAGTGFAMPICIAIMAGGAAMLKYSDEIAAWMCKYYPCPECGGKSWDTVSEDQLKISEFESTAISIENYDEVDVFPVMREMYCEAEEYLYLSFPWYNLECVENDWPMLKKAQQRGVKIYIYYGMKPRSGRYEKEDIKRACRTNEAINFLYHKLGESNVVYCPVDCHIKMMVCEKYSLQGSHNLFSYRPKYKSRGEVTTKMTGKKAVDEARGIIKAQDEFTYFNNYQFD